LFVLICLTISLILKAGSAFTIKHFAGDVEYFCDGFLDKNKDTVFEDQVCIYKEIILNNVSTDISFYNIYLF